MLNDIFRIFAQKTSKIVGSAWTFIFAFLLIILWLFTGPYFSYSNTWQLVINTTTTIITFLMVFLIQNTQNRDAKAIHLKLDELLRAVKGARLNLMDAEELPERQIDQSFEELKLLNEKHKHLEEKRKLTNPQ